MTFSARKPFIILLLALAGLMSQTASAQLPCPDMARYYPSGDDPADWDSIERQLRPLMTACLQDAEYFALIGAALMNTGQLPDALEALERALLLEPGHGAAQVDYAQALYLQGQLFSALAMNRHLLTRSDLPATLRNALQQRQRDWQSRTRQFYMQADVLAGYNSNLNGAPTPGEITLTLSGENVILPLAHDFRPVSGSYGNIRLGGRYRQLAPSHQHNVLVELRSRVSENRDSDLLQLDSRYAFIKPSAKHSWQASAGQSHLFYGRSALYTATEVGGRYVPTGDTPLVASCVSHLTGASQHQLFHNQSRLNAVETKIGTGLICPWNSNGKIHQLGVDLSALINVPLHSDRAGGTRQGWQVNLEWVLDLPGDRGQLAAQASHTQMFDAQGYHELLNEGAEREIRRSYIFLQYRRDVSPRATLLVNVYRQYQGSNLELFRTGDSAFEAGFSVRF